MLKAKAKTRVAIRQSVKNFGGCRGEVVRCGADGVAVVKLDKWPKGVERPAFKKDDPKADQVKVPVSLIDEV